VAVAELNGSGRDGSIPESGGCDHGGGSEGLIVSLATLNLLLELRARRLCVLAVETKSPWAGQGRHAAPDLTGPQCSHNTHIAHRTMALKLMRCAAHRRGKDGLVPEQLKFRNHRNDRV
jgi:hypothetical protein